MQSIVLIANHLHIQFTMLKNNKMSSKILNSVFIFSFITMNLPIWSNGRYASLMSILYTIICDNLGVDVNFMTLIVFLLPIYIVFYLLFNSVESTFVKYLLLIMYFLINLPFGAMLPP